MKRSISLFLIILLTSFTIIYGQQPPVHTKLPKELLGEWYTQNGGQLIYGLYERGVVYNNSFWQYQSIIQRANKVIIQLTNVNNEKVHLKIKHTKNLYTFHARGSKTVICQKDLSKCTVHHDLPQIAFPRFQADSIYVHYFLLEPHGEKVSIKIHQLLTGITTNHFNTVDKEGFVEFSIPVNNPVLLDIKLPYRKNQPEEVYMLPGTTLLLIQTKAPAIHYGGNAAQLALEFKQLITDQSDYHPDPLTALQSAHFSDQNYSPTDFKTFMKSLKSDLESHLDSLYKRIQISPLTYQIGKYQIQYTIAAALIRYHDYTKQSTDITKINRYEQPPLPNSYYDFLKPLDNDSAFIAPSYFDFIQSFRDQNSTVDLPDIGLKGVQPATSATIDELGTILLPLENLHPPLNELQKTILNNFQQITSTTEKKNYSKQHAVQIKEMATQYNSIVQFKTHTTFIQDQCKLKLGWTTGITTDLINYANLTLQLFDKGQSSLPADYFTGPYAVFHTPFIGKYIKEYTSQSNDENDIIIKINKNSGIN